MDKTKVAKELTAIARLLSEGTGKEVTAGNKVVAKLVKTIADAESKRISILNKAGDEAFKLNGLSGKAQNELERYLRLRVDMEGAREALELLKKSKVDTGEMSSRLIDIVEELGGESIYPPSWAPKKPKWAIVSN